MGNWTLSLNRMRADDGRQEINLEWPYAYVLRECRFLGWNAGLFKTVSKINPDFTK